MYNVTSKRKNAMFGISIEELVVILFFVALAIFLIFNIKIEKK